MDSSASSLNIAMSKWLEREGACIQFERDIERPYVVICFLDCATTSFSGTGSTPYDAFLKAWEHAVKAGIAP